MWDGHSIKASAPRGAHLGQSQMPQSDQVRSGLLWGVVLFTFGVVLFTLGGGPVYSGGWSCEGPGKLLGAVLGYVKGWWSCENAMVLPSYLSSAAGAVLGYENGDDDDGWPGEEQGEEQRPQGEEQHGRKEKEGEEQRQ